MNRPTLGLALAVGLGLTASAWAQASFPRTVYITVADSDGRPLADVQATDISVTEDGQPRQVLSLGPAAEPMTIAVVVDDHGLGLPEVRQAATDFTAAMPATASIGLFSTRFVEWTVTDFTRDRQALNRGIQHLVPMAGGHDLEGLIRHLADDFRKRAVARPVIVLVTIGQECRVISASMASSAGCDGGGSLSPNWDRVVEQVRRTRTTFYAVAAHQTHPRDMLIIDASTEVSGGRVDATMTTIGIVGSMGRIADDIRAQYRLEYAGTSVPERGARLRVHAARPDVTIRAPQRVY